jgi:uncharacterized membrane protein YbhN (UPF0104 family)
LLVSLSDGAMTAAGATAVALIVRLLTFWWAVLLGVLALLVWRARYGRTAQRVAELADAASPVSVPKA